MKSAFTGRWMFGALVALAIPAAVSQSQSPVLAQGRAVMQAQAPAAVATQQQFQVTLLQNNLALGGTLMFATDAVNADGTIGGTFAANVEGQLLVGRFVASDSGVESLWIAQASGGQFGLIARGWKTEERLVGQTSLSLANGSPLFGDTFFILGQGAFAQTAAPGQTGASTFAR